MTYEYFKVPYGADTTEKGTTCSIAYIRIVKGQWVGNDLLLAQVREFCRRKLGPEVEYVQGVSPCLNWYITPSDYAQWCEAKRPTYGNAMRFSIATNGPAFVMELDEENPHGAPKLTYAELLEQNEQLKAKLASVNDGKQASS